MMNTWKSVVKVLEVVAAVATVIIGADKAIRNGKGK